MADLLVRKFYLENYEGQIKELLPPTQTTPFLYTPSGLGIEFDVETIEYINRSLISKVTVNRPDIKGTIVFETYEQYIEFTDWVTKSQSGLNFDYKNPRYNMKLHYITQEEGFETDPGYYEVFVTVINKTEKDANTGLLECPIVFKRLTNYKIPTIIEQNNGLDPTIVSGTFPLPTNNPDLNENGNTFIKFGIPDEEAGIIRFGLVYNGQVPAPVKFTISGAYNHPTWTNTADGTSGGYNVSSLGSNELVVDANLLQYMEQNGVDISQTQDKFKENFLKLMPGYNEIVFELGQTEAYTNIKLEYSFERWTN